MRIDRIDLVRYGHFSGEAIDLPLQQPDFTIIYGNNEAGKSTLLRGMSALFFGVPTKTPDVHSCKGSELRIGAAISNGSNRLIFRRRKVAASMVEGQHASVSTQSLLMRINADAG